MNYLKSFLLVTLTVVCLSIKVSAQSGVAINTTGSSADASAMLDVSSTSKGFLLPRLTSTQRDAISLPATGLSIYNTTLNALQVNIGTPASPIWSTISTASAGWLLTGNSGITSSNFIGSTNNVALNFRTNNVQRMTIDNSGKVGIGTAAPGTMLHVVAPASSDPLTLMGVQVGSTNTTDSVLTISSGVVKKVPASTFQLGGTDWSLLGNGGITSSNFLGTTNNIGLNFRTNNVQRMTIDNSGKVGIGTAAPGTMLHVVAPASSDPLTLMGVQVGSTNTTDSLLTISSGVVKKVPASTFQLSGTDWSLLGNGGITSSNFLGTTNNIGLNFRTNNVQRMTIDNTGNVGIGVTSPNALLHIVAPSGSNPLNLTGVSTGANTDSILTIINGVVKKLPGSTFQLSGTDWSLLGNGGITSSNFLGTTNNIGLNFRTNNVQRMTIDNTGNVGIGVTSPSALLHIVAPSGSNPLNLTGVATGANTDSILTIINGVVKKLPASTFQLSGTDWSLLGNGSITSSNFLGTTNNIGLNFRTNNVQRMTIDNSGKVGIGTAAPGTMLHVVAPPSSDPLTLIGVQAGSTSDSVLTIASGVVKKLPASSFASPTTAWMLAGNSIGSSAFNFLGTTDNTGLSVRTNGRERMYVDSVGRVGIGSQNFSSYNPKLLVDYDTATSSNTIAYFKGEIDDYFQINLRNKSNGANASTDFVATADNGTDSTNYIDMGINSSNYLASKDNFGGPNDGYLFVSAKNFLLGTDKASTDIIFLSGGGSTKNNATLKIDGGTKNIIIGKGENTNAPVGNTLRGPNASGTTTNIAGGSLTIQGGSATTTATGGSVNINGGASATGSYGSININANLNAPTNINTGTSTQNITIGGASNNIIFPKFPTVGGLIYTAAATGQIGSLTSGTNGYVLQSNGAGSAPSWVNATSLNTNSWLLGGNSVASNQNLGTTTNYDLPFITNNTEQMRLTKTGWLGIGTNNPQGTFHVTADNSEFGDDYFFEDYGTSTTQGLYFRKARGTQAAPANLANGDLISWIRFAPRTGGSFPFNNNAGFGAYYKGNGTTDLEDLRFYTSSAEQMRLDENGRLGINTTSPTEILDVAGNIRFSGALMPNNAAGTSGYVLKSNGTGTAPTWVDVNTLVTASATSGWGLSGNSATASSFLGTTNGQPLVFKVNNIRAGYIGLSGSSYATAIGVNSDAAFQSTAFGANADAGTNGQAVALGYNATANGFQSIALGASSTTTSQNQSIAIGYNSSTSSYQGIAIGASAAATTNNSTLALGNSASSSGYQSMALGNSASASGQNSIAIGNGISATNANEMAFGNSSNNTIRFSGATYNVNRALIVGTNNTNGNGAYLTNGGTWTNASDRNLKEDFSQLSGADLLAKISQLNITRWKYKGTNEYHIGPMAQDFFGLFNVGTDDKHISTIDPSGVALAAIKALNEKVDQQQNEIDILIQEVKALKDALKKQ